jgi:organic hydroperoxide reductase OsmC/OhrA
VPVRTRSSSSQPDISGSAVPAEVGIGKNDGGFGIIGKISADILNVDAATAKDLIEKAHQVCPYSNATRGNITVELVV